jgi:hypothetical protein
MIEDLSASKVTNCSAKMLREEKNIGSPLILVSLTHTISYPIFGRHRSSPMLSPLAWQVI